VALFSWLPSVREASGWDEDPGIYPSPERLRKQLDDLRKQLDDLRERLLQEMRDEQQRLDDEHRLQRSRVCDQVSGLERDLAELRTKYTDWHPRVQILKERMEQLKRKVGDCSLKHEVSRLRGGSVLLWALWMLSADGPTILSTHTSYDDCMITAQNQIPPGVEIRTPEHSPVFGCRWVD
jgi:hypothetical protein